MQFSDTTNKNGILQKCEFYVFGNTDGAITDNSTLKSVFTGLVNDAQDSIVSDILDSDTRWQWDDTNRTDFPIGMNTLVDGQRDYTLEVDHLKILGVEVKDSTGQYYKLEPIDLQDLREKNITPTEFYKTNGLPQFYDKIANSIMLYPQPDAGNVTLTNGLKVHFQRGAEYFVAGDTTRVPGFASIYHKLVPLMASYDYAFSNDMFDKADRIDLLITRTTKKMKNFFSKRDKDRKPRITMKTKNAK
jgi:hypothetical protein